MQSLYLAQPPSRGMIRLFKANAMIRLRDQLPGFCRRFGGLFRNFRLIGHSSACAITAAVGGAIAPAFILIPGKRPASLDAGIVAGGAHWSGDCLVLLTARLTMLNFLRGML